MRVWLQYLLIFSLTFVLARWPLLAQVSMAEFLQSANTDHEMASFGEQIRYLDTKPYRLSPLQKVEFRTESNQLDPSRQDYGLRFNPANPWEIKKNNNYYEQYKSVLYLRKDLALKDALMVRYHYIIQWLYYDAMKSVKEENKQLTTAQISILEKQRHSDFFNAEDFVELKLDQMEQTVELEEVTFERDNQLSKMAGVYPAMAQKQLDWRYENIISVDRIEGIVDSLSKLQSTPTTLLFRENQIELANREYLLEKSNINIGFLQTQYQQYRIEQGRNPWSISLGVTIPIANPNKGDMTKRKLDVIEAQHERDETEAELMTDKTGSREQLKNLIARYRDIREKISALNESTLSSTLSAMKEDNPAVSLRFAANVLKLKTLEIKIKQNILITYIEFLGYTDMIQRQPLINYLNEDLEQIGIQ